MCAGDIRAAGAVGAGGRCRSLARMAARVRDVWLHTEGTLIDMLFGATSAAIASGDRLATR